MASLEALSVLVWRVTGMIQNVGFGGELQVDGMER